MSEHCARFRDVGKRYDDLWVLQDVSLELPARHTSAIVGESGCGKTTLLQLANGVLRPDAGTIDVLGGPVPTTDVEAFRRRIGYAVQGAGLFPHLTVRANVTLLARLEGWPAERIAERFEELLDEMGLAAGLADQYPIQLSGGQQQRAGLCRALMLKPDMLLLDEPFSALDPISRVELCEQFASAQRQEGVSALLVTHDMREAAQLADYLVILGEGGVLQAGATTEVIAKPRPGYVERLLNTQLGDLR